VGRGWAVDEELVLRELRVRQVQPKGASLHRFSVLDAQGDPCPISDVVAGAPVYVRGLLFMQDRPVYGTRPVCMPRRPCPRRDGRHGRAPRANTADPDRGAAWPAAGVVGAV
jgi:hypothetical protein